MNNILEAYSIFLKTYYKQIIFLNKKKETYNVNTSSLLIKQVNWADLLFKDLVTIELHKNRLAGMINASNSARYIRKQNPIWYCVNYFISFFKIPLHERNNKFSFFYELSKKVYFY